jgi:cytochrome P450
VEDWTQVKIHDVLLKLVSQTSARVFVGEPACRDEAWLEASSKYAEQAMITVFILRAMPKFVQPLVALFLPSYWNATAWSRKAVGILVPIIQARRKAETNDADFRKPIDFLQGMIEMANEHDGYPEKLARRALIMGLASIHLTAMAAAHAMYDLCARPEYMEPLREELIEVQKEDGGWGKRTVGKMRKTDSFLRESQRLSPPSLCML